VKPPAKSQLFAGIGKAMKTSTCLLALALCVASNISFADSANAWSEGPRAGTEAAAVRQNAALQQQRLELQRQQLELERQKMLIDVCKSAHKDNGDDLLECVSDLMNTGCK
jgi:hypothetical protein